MFEWATEQREYALAQLYDGPGEHEAIYQRMVARMDVLLGLIAAAGASNRPYDPQLGFGADRADQAEMRRSA